MRIEQHTCPEYWCVNCVKAFTADLPSPIETGGLVGPRLTTLIAYLKGVCQRSRADEDPSIRPELVLDCETIHVLAREPAQRFDVSCTDAVMSTAPKSRRACV